MNEMERLEQALKALRETDQGRGASDFVETRLRAAFREHHARKSRRWPVAVWKWAAAAACSAVLAIAVMRLVQPEPVQAPPVTAAIQPRIHVPAPTAIQQPEAVVAARAVRKPLPRPARPRRTEEEFVAIPYAPPFTSFDQGQVVRVRVPRQSLRSLGVPVDEGRMLERIPADLLMGEDGVPRAIRIVSERR